MEIVSSGDIFNEQKSIVFSVIVIAIPITLATIYKANKNKTTKQKIKKYYLYYGCGKNRREKKMKKKTEKKVINSINGEKQIQIIINSTTQKK
ncbi:hypothetical protein YYC_04762 [Plasmodium yoelii 17X]|uniref:PYST-C1-like N-terminal domain-containing protein n=1 Tax=Plasmodium yoelii 17X TaxID=1323249 RepID=V7PEJ5_PLAYE|nr:hypothetical protein YYC_04762 [Plasmodium yoelii 17X]